MPLIEHVREPIAAAIMLCFLLPKLNILEVVITAITHFFKFREPKVDVATSLGCSKVSSSP
jgi:hypothetical protein